MTESSASREKTFCCGKGGGANGIAPEKADTWANKCLEEADGRPLVSYCASCTKAFAEHVPAHHLLDLLFSSTTTLAGQTKAAKAPLTYLNRLNVKRRLRRTLAVAVSRERTFRPEGQVKPGSFAKKALLCLLPFALGLLLLSRGMG